MARPDRGLHTHVVGELGRRIVGGEYAPQHTLDLAALADDLEVSHTVLREALRALAEKRLVAARPRRGTYVRPREDWNLLDRDVLTWRYESHVDMDLLRDLAEVRLSLEPTAAALAAKRRTQTDVEELTETVEVFREAGRDGQESSRVMAADLRFHRALFRAAHNEVLLQMELIVEIGLRARNRLVHAKPQWQHTAELHAAIADAVTTGDPVRAEEATKSLLRYSAATLEYLDPGSH